MNEYTRREEVRWILFSAVTLVLCVGAAMVSLVTAQGRLGPDPAAQEAADKAADDAKALDGVAAMAGKFSKELPQFRKNEELALAPPPPEPPKPVVRPRGAQKPEKKVEDNSGLAWPSAQATYQAAKELAPYAAPVKAAAPPSADAAAGWKAIAQAAAVAPPADSDKPAQVAAAKQVYDALAKAPIDAVASNIADANAALAATADKANANAKTAKVRKPLPRGLIGREAAIGLGVLIALAALLVHFFSLRQTSIRRGATLQALRPTAHTPQRGYQASAILRLASEGNGGEPGLVLGCALGGLISAIVVRQNGHDADWFVVGTMGGLVLGVLIQIALRATVGTESKFRARALELAEVEKPTVPIVLVLSTIEKGREGAWLDAFLKLNHQGQSDAVDKLAQQAEERILVAADAQAGR